MFSYVELVRVLSQNSIFATKTSVFSLCSVKHRYIHRFVRLISMLSFEITKQIPDLSVVKHCMCKVIRTIYLFLVYFVCVDHFIHCT